METRDRSYLAAQVADYMTDKSVAKKNPKVAEKDNKDEEKKKESEKGIKATEQEKSVEKTPKKSFENKQVLVTTLASKKRKIIQLSDVDESGKQVTNEVEKKIKAKKYMNTYNQFVEKIAMISALLSKCIYGM